MVQLPIVLFGTSALLVALSPAVASSHGYSRHAVGLHARQAPGASTGQPGGPGPTPTSVSGTRITTSSTTASSTTTSSSTTSRSSSAPTTTTRSTTTTSSTSSTTSTITTSSTSSSSSESSSSIESTSSSSSTSSVVTTSSSSSSITSSSTQSTPAVTFSFANPLVPPSSSFEEVPVAETSVPQGRTGGAKKEDGFLQNKGAVAGTFTVVGLVVIASLVLIISLIMRRRRAKTFEADWFDKEIPGHGASSPSRSHSPGASITDLHTQAPMEASYGDPFRDYHHQVAPVSYGTTQQAPSASYGYNHHNNDSSYSADIPSNTYLQSHTQEAQRASPPQPPSAQMLPTLFQNNAVLYSTGPLLAPAQPSHARTLPVARGSYQPSVDSFYGGQAM